MHLEVVQYLLMVMDHWHSAGACPDVEGVMPVYGDHDMRLLVSLDSEEAERAIPSA